MEHFFACGEKSSWYHAYHFISDYCDSPFTNLQPDTLFQVALYLINSLSHTTLPRGISRAKILYTLAKQASFLGAYEVARFALRSMQDLKIPSIWEDRIELDSILIQVMSSNCPLAVIIADRDFIMFPDQINHRSNAIFHRDTHFRRNLQKIAKIFYLYVIDVDQSAS